MDSVFLPLKACTKAKQDASRVGSGDTGCSGKFSGSESSVTRSNFGNGESKYVDSGGSGVCDDGGKNVFSSALRPCSNKRKDRDGVDGGDAGGSSGFRAVKDSNLLVQAKPLGMLLFSFYCLW